MSEQADLFGSKGQGELFTPEPRTSFRPNPDDIREKLNALLAQARSADSMPWTPRKLLFNRTVFPQMTDWLPDEEAAQLRFEFEEELRRLEAA